MKLAIFDFDGTILNFDTFPGLGGAWRQQNRSRLSFYRTWLRMGPILLRYRLRRLPKLMMKQMLTQHFICLFRGMNQTEIRAFFAEAYYYLAAFFNPLVLQELTAVQRDGYHTVLLSGAFQELLEVVAEHLGVQSAIGSQMRYDERGIVDLRQRVDCVLGEDKYTRLIAHFHGQTVYWEKSCSYADSYTDISVLAPVGAPVLVNPDAKLSAWGLTRQCRVISA
jgi:HAD superfamily phosphoserine phosphatase-like hydrolase